jgi:acyl transferase domain-containing protein
MVQTEISQLGMEARQWVEKLRQDRSELNAFRQSLQDLMGYRINRESMPQVEHYDNQFDIQLSNINHLKHAVKEHERQLVWEETHPDTLSDGQIHTAHEELADRFGSLSHTISELKSEFESFLREQP